MSDLKKYIQKRKRAQKEFALNIDVGYEDFKIGVILRQALLTSESALKKDWNSPKEDQAWQNL